MMDQNIYTASTFAKGQVWSVTEPKEITNAKISDGSHVIAKSRPYVIYISEYQSQKESFVVQGFPCTTTIQVPESIQNSRFEGDMLFSNPTNTRVGRVLMDQLTTIDTQYITRYICTLPKVMIDKMDEYMKKYFGFTENIIDISREIDSLRARLDDLTRAAREIYDSFDYKKAGDKLVPIPVASQQSIRRGGDAPLIDLTSDNTHIVRHASGRIAWSPDLMQAFLHDYETLPKQELMTKWDLDKSQIYRVRLYCKKKIDGR